MRGTCLVGQLRDANLYGPKSSLENLESLERLESLESLENLERLESLQSLDSPKSLESLIRLERLQSLQALESAERLERLDTIRQDSFITATNSDYRDYAHEEGDVVYCDPPYANTDQYKAGDFDSVAFWEWARTRDYPVYVSEYSAPDDFVSIWSKEKRSLFNNKQQSALKVEHLFVHRRFA